MMYRSSTTILLATTVALTMNADRVSAAKKDHDNGASGLMDMVSAKLDEASGNLRRSLVAEDMSICDLFQIHFSNPFRLDAPRGDCECTGTLANTTTLQCSFENVCDSILCADIQMNATLTHMIDPDSPHPFRLSEDPEMKVSACVDVTDPAPMPLEQMCLELDFAKPHFFIPKDCSFSYGDQECVCVIDRNGGEHGLPCYAFDCSEVAPEELATILVASTCKSIDLGAQHHHHHDEEVNDEVDVLPAVLAAGAAFRHEKDPVAVFLPALADLPGETMGQQQDLPEGLTAMDVEFMGQVVAAEEEELEAEEEEGN